MDFCLSHSSALDRIVTGNILDVKHSVDIIEDSGFDAEEVKCSTKKSLDENLENVWQMLNAKQKHQIDRELDWIEVNDKDLFKVPLSKNRKETIDWFENKVEHVISEKPLKHNRKETIDWFENKVEHLISEKPLKHVAEDSGIFKLSLDELSISEPQHFVRDLPDRDEVEWNDGNFSTNAVSEPWSLSNPYYTPANYVEYYEDASDDIGETVEESKAKTPEESKAGTPHKSNKRFLPFNISNLLGRHKSQRKGWK